MTICGNNQDNLFPLAAVGFCPGTPSTAWMCAMCVKTILAEIIRLSSITCLTAVHLSTFRMMRC